MERKTVEYTGWSIPHVYTYQKRTEEKFFNQQQNEAVPMDIVPNAPQRAVADAPPRAVVDLELSPGKVLKEYSAEQLAAAKALVDAAKEKLESMKNAEWEDEEKAILEEQRLEKEFNLMKLSARRHDLAEAAGHQDPMLAWDKNRLTRAFEGRKAVETKLAEEFRDDLDESKKVSREYQRAKLAAEAQAYGLK